MITRMISHTWLFFIFHKFNAIEAFKQFLADRRGEGIPSQVMVVDVVVVD